MSLKEKIVKEALVQKDLKAKHLPISAEHKKYARLAGMIIAIVSGLGCGIILLISYTSDRIFVFAILFTGVLALIGFAQFVSGRHILTRR